MVPFSSIEKLKGVSWISWLNSDVSPVDPSITIAATRSPEVNSSGQPSTGSTNVTEKFPVLGSKVVCSATLIVPRYNLLLLVLLNKYNSSCGSFIEFKSEPSTVSVSLLNPTKLISGRSMPLLPLSGSRAPSIASNPSPELISNPPDASGRSCGRVISMSNPLLPSK